MPNNFDELRQRITIREILEDYGITVSGKRIACPIHDGNNKTSFSFTNSAFNCFSCGRRGGLVDLVMCLRDCDWNEALVYLENRTGLKLTRVETESGKPQPVSYIPRKLAKWRPLEVQLGNINWSREAGTEYIQNLEKLVKIKKISLADYYAKRQYWEYELNHLDSQAMAVIHEINLLKREVN